MSLLDALKHVLSRRILFHPDQLQGQELQFSSSFTRHLISRWIRRRHYTQQNRESIRLFRETFARLFGSARARRICSRYNIDLEELERKGKALKERHIAKLLTGAADVGIEDIEELLAELRDPATISLRYLGIKETAQLRTEFSEVMNWRQLTAFKLQRLIDILVPTTRYRLKSTKEIFPNPTQFSAYLFHDRLLMDLERQELHLEASTIEDADAYCELLAKGLAYREMKEGTLIPAPSSSGRPSYYYVAAAIFTGNGLVAYGLLPATSDLTELRPLLLFRGSLFIPSGLDAISTYITDLERNIGKSAYRSGKEALRSFIETIHGQRLLVMGHSLGGNLAQWFVSDNAHVVDELITYNAPCLPKEEVEDFIKKSRQLNHRLKIRVYRTEGDIVHRAGDKHLGHGCDANKVDISLTEFCPDKKSKTRRHKSRFLNRRRREVAKRVIQDEDRLHHELSNHHRYSLERLRKYGGGYFICHILRAMRFVSRRFWSPRLEKHH